jgi:thiol:disulfide interchange protein DsbC
MKKHYLIALAATFLVAASAQADEAEIRIKLPQRIPDLPKIEDVRMSVVPGLYEVVAGGDVIYVDEHGEYLIHGNLIQTKTMHNLTEEREAKLASFDFNSLPLQDALVWKSGTGKRRMVIFSDPNCGYCKRLEKDVQQLKDVTVYTFLIPILGGDSPQKAQNIWCSKNATQTYLDWMLTGVTPPRFMGMGCATPLERNVALARKVKVEATPAIFFENGTRIRGAAGVAEIEKRLSGAKS